MILTGTEKLDGLWRLVMYETDAAGGCAPTYTPTEFNNEINEYYEQQAERFARLRRQLEAEEISPVGFFVAYFRLDPKDVAARTRLRLGVVKKHLQPAGFASARVADLQAYARVFNLAVADFFYFLQVPPGQTVRETRQGERLRQLIELRPTGDAGSKSA